MATRDQANKARATHRHAGRGRVSKTYRAWLSMKARCSDPANISWSRYGGRGIKVCERWAKFETFLADLGECPSAQHSLDRVDTNKNYTPENCRWATKHEQGNNRSTNRVYAWAGQTLTVRQWADVAGVGYSYMYARLCVRGWTIAEALGLRDRRDL